MKTLEKFEDDLLLFQLHGRPWPVLKHVVAEGGVRRGSMEAAIQTRGFTPSKRPATRASGWEEMREDGTERWISKQLIRDDLCPEGLLMLRE